MRLPGSRRPHARGFGRASRIHLEPTGTGTTITQSFTVVRAPWLLDRLYARLIPSHQDRDARLAEDLARIGTTARQAS